MRGAKNSQQVIFGIEYLGTIIAIIILPRKLIDLLDSYLFMMPFARPFITAAHLCNHFSGHMRERASHIITEINAKLEIHLINLHEIWIKISQLHAALMHRKHFLSRRVAMHILKYVIYLFTSPHQFGLGKPTTTRNANFH